MKLASDILREDHLRATAYAKQLVITMQATHYPEGPSIQPFDDLEGLLSQIDNMVSGLERRRHSLNFTIRTTRFCWPAYLMQGRTCIAWLWGKKAVNVINQLL